MYGFHDRADVPGKIIVSFLANHLAQDNWIVLSQSAKFEFFSSGSVLPGNIQSGVSFYRAST